MSNLQEKISQVLSGSVRGVYLTNDEVEEFKREYTLRIIQSGGDNWEPGAIYGFRVPDATGVKLTLDTICPDGVTPNNWLSTY